MGISNPGTIKCRLVSLMGSPATTASPCPLSVRLRGRAGQQQNPLPTQILIPQHVTEVRMRRARTMAAYSRTLMLAGEVEEVLAPKGGRGVEGGWREGG